MGLGKTNGHSAALGPTPLPTSSAPPDQEAATGGAGNAGGIQDRPETRQSCVAPWAPARGRAGALGALCKSGIGTMTNQRHGGSWGSQ